MQSEVLSLLLDSCEDFRIQLSYLMILTNSKCFRTVTTSFQPASEGTTRPTWSAAWCACPLARSLRNKVVIAGCCCLVIIAILFEDSTFAFLEVTSAFFSVMPRSSSSIFSHSVVYGGGEDFADWHPRFWCLQLLRRIHGQCCRRVPTIPSPKRPVSFIAFLCLTFENF